MNLPDRVRMNVMWVVAQVLLYNDHDLDVYEFAKACGVGVDYRNGKPTTAIARGLRRYSIRALCRPGVRPPDDKAVPWAHLGHMPPRNGGK
jgi:hypothetical protein